MAGSQGGNPGESISGLLSELAQGNRDAEARLISQVYDELHRLAQRYMRDERVNHTLQPTALVNEAYLRLIDQPHLSWQSRAHFFAAAAQVMRHILVDHARARAAGKRGGVQNQVTLDEALIASDEQTVDILALHEALESLAGFDPRQARIVELHFFGGLSFPEIAFILGIAERTAKGDWAMARAWLKTELSKRP